jgi:uncharacterized protein (TIGR00369 family)
MHEDLQPQGLDAALGFAVDEAGPDRVVMSWDVGHQHRQPHGIVHGGVYCAVVEGAASRGAALWLGDRGRIVGVVNNTNFLRPVSSGHLVATATPVHRGRRQQLWQVAIVDEQDKLVARGEVRLQNLTD